MKFYRVAFSARLTAHLIVQADSREEAMQKSEEEIRLSNYEVTKFTQFRFTSVRRYLE